MNDVPPVAIPVFSVDDYGTVLQMISESGEEMHVPYEQYVASAEEHAAELQASGVIVHRVPVLPERLRYWCEKHQRPLDREAISLYAISEMTENA